MYVGATLGRVLHILGRVLTHSNYAYSVRQPTGRPVGPRFYFLARRSAPPHIAPRAPPRRNTHFIAIHKIKTHRRSQKTCVTYCDIRARCLTPAKSTAGFETLSGERKLHGELHAKPEVATQPRTATPSSRHTTRRLSH